MAKIFISYRRKSWAFTHRLVSDLRNSINADIFIDYSGIDESDFEVSILSHLRSSDLVLLVVSEYTFSDRISNDGDWVRREIRMAMELDLPIVLVCVEGLLPPKSGLPEDISGIRRMQGVNFYPEYWDAAVDRLADFLCKLRPEQIERKQRAIEASEERKNSEPIRIETEQVIPLPREWHQASAIDSLDIPIGVNIDDKNLSSIILGEYPQHNLLIMGRPGSGNTNLMNTFILSAATKYAPSEVEFYLIDMLTSSEYQAYSRFQVPNIKVFEADHDSYWPNSAEIAIKTLMEKRLETLKDNGSFDYTTYRKDSNENVPRTIIVINDAQELSEITGSSGQQTLAFIEDILRRGRAFGIHVVLCVRSMGNSPLHALKRIFPQATTKLIMNSHEEDLKVVLSGYDYSEILQLKPGQVALSTDGMNFSQIVQNPFVSGEILHEYLGRLHV